VHPTHAKRLGQPFMSARLRPGSSIGFLRSFRRRIGGFSIPVSLAAILPLAVLPPHAIALPTGGQLVTGSVTATVNGTQLTLDQASRAAIMNWQSFNIAPHEAVRLLQPGADAAMLARVIGGNPTELLGRLQADGKLFLINPRGILVGQGAVIDTAAFLASTLDVADADFLRGGSLTFKGESAAGVVNLGRITAREGDVLLLAHTVRNDGEISAARGTAGLAAGTEVFLAAPDASAVLVRANLPATTAATGVENSGVIEAAQARLEAAGGSIYDLAMNQSGLVRAAGYEHRDGRVVLTAAGGNVAVTGVVSARNADGSGGTILVGGDFQGKNPAVANAANTHVGPAARLDASVASATGAGGRVIVWADEGTRFLGAIEARAGATGGDGGFAEVSGKRTLTFAGTADLSAPAGTRGELLLDPDNITIVAGATSLPSGLDGDPTGVWSFSEDAGSQTLGADTLASLLLNSSVTLQAHDTLTVDSPVSVASGGTASVTLTLQASTLAINQSVSLANVTDGRLHLVHNISGPGTSLTTVSGATLSAPKLRIDGFPITTLNGPVSTNQLTYVNLQAPTSLTTTHISNSIAEFLLVSDEADPQVVNFSGNVSVHSNSALNVSARLASDGDVAISSAGNLTVRDFSGAVPFATGLNVTGKATLASTGGVFINQAGSDLFTGAGRRLLYTANTSGAFSLDGLTGYTQVDGVSYPSDPNSGVTLVLYNAAGGGPVLTLTITANDFIRLYGQANPTFTASYSGGTASDLTTLPTFSILGGPAVNVGTYTIVPSGAASATHSLSYVNGTLTVNPATLTYVANPASRLYGDANPAFSGTVTGFVNGDTLGSATTGTLTFTSPASAASDAGSHAINGSGLTANHGNYTFVQASGNATALTVDKAPLTVAFNNATRAYGAANPQFTATFTGFRNGDTAATLAGFTPGTNANAQSPVGTYQIGAAPTATNYTINIVPGTLTITPVPLTLQIGSATWVYGEAGPVPSLTVSGLVAGDTAAAVVRAVNPTTIQSSVGAYTVVPELLTGNYTLGSVSGGALTITPRPLLVAVGDAVKRQFEGLPAFNVSLSGVTPFDLAAATAHFSRPTTPAEAGSPPGTYEVRPVGDPASPFPNLANYSVTLRPGTLRVEPPPTEIVTSTFLFHLDPNKEEQLKKEAEQIELSNRIQVTSTIHGLGHPAYRPLMDDAVNRLRQAAGSDPELRRTLQENGLLDLLTRGGNDAFLADVSRDATKQSLLISFINEVMLDYARRPQETLTPEIARLVDHLKERAREQKQKEALLIVAQYDKWAKEKAEKLESLGAVGQFQALYGWTAVPPDFKQQIKAEQMAAAIGSGLVAGAITGAGLGGAFAAKTAAFVAAGTTGKVLAGVAGTAAGFGAGAGAVVLAAVIIGVVRGIQVFDEERVMADVQAARDMLRNPGAISVNLQDDFDRMSFSTGVMNFINDNGFKGM